MSTPVRPEVALGGRSLTSAEDTGLERDAIGFWGVFAQGLAAAAPSVAIAVVPFSLFVAAGRGRRGADRIAGRSAGRAGRHARP